VCEVRSEDVGVVAATSQFHGRPVTEAPAQPNVPACTDAPRLRDQGINDVGTGYLYGGSYFSGYPL
jgi:hypothetical protein